MKDIESLVMTLSNNFTEIISRDIVKNYEELNWGDNGIGDRWANKKFNYTVIYSTGYKTYSECDVTIDSDKINDFLKQ